ncbi:MAG: type II toxin-antitoxin system Phd/YefM family antitoxin [Candidatus Protochlamydia sp.]|nr:type II toxin-antitoxin system Phd/YefM family antitoxin [Candidatus Protochlamydia sp.]
MHFINIHDAKTHLSRYLEQLINTHEPIVICRNGKPIAQLVEYKQKKIRKLGLLKGKIKMSADFNTLPDDFMENFE